MLLKHSRGNDKAAMAGFNYRMTEQAARIAQLKKLKFILEKIKKDLIILKKH